MKLDLVPPQWQTSRAREREKREERERRFMACKPNEGRRRRKHANRRLVELLTKFETPNRFCGATKQFPH